MGNKQILLSVLIVGVIFGVLADRLLADQGSRASITSHDSSCNDEFSLLNPMLRCEPEQNLRVKKEFTELKAKLNERIARAAVSGEASHVSVYLRDLQFGPWMGIEEREPYSSASILKVPVLLAVLKQAEQNPQLLDQTVQLDPSLRFSDQKFPPRDPVKPSATYTVRELLERMIIQSDNNAKNALHLYLDYLNPLESIMYHTMEELGLVGVYREDSDELNVKQVASLMRILYNGSYLNKEMSQYALDLLARSEFNLGIVQGVPYGTVVAHKFGERELGAEEQLHDCAIVYYKYEQYLLCIMTRGTDVMKLAKLIANITGMVSEEARLRSP